MKLNYKELLTGLFRDFRNTHNQNVKDIQSDMTELLSKTTNAQTSADIAKDTADSAVNKADNVQKQVDTLVIQAGESSPQVLQALTNSTGETFGTLKEVLDDKDYKLDFTRKRNLQSVVKRYPSPVLERYAFSSGFAFNNGTIPIVIFKDRYGNFTTNFDVADFMLTGGKTIYVHSVNGLSTNDGLTVDTPRNSVQSALSIANDGDTIIILDKKDSVLGRTNGWISDGYITKNVNIIATNEIIVFFGDVLTYTKTAGFTNVYESARSNVERVADFNGEPNDYIKVNSIAECDSSPGSWYTNGTTLYVHRFGGKIPNNKILGLLNGGAALRPVSTRNVKFYVENITFVGGASVLRFIGTDTYTDGEVYAKNCKFLFPITTNDSVLVQNAKSAFFQNCIAAYSRKDGFNYAATGAGKKPDFIEVNCQAYANGDNVINSSTPDTYNGSTAHVGCRGIRVNGAYYENVGGNVTDVHEGTKSVNLGCLAFGSRATQNTYNQGFSNQQSGTEMWIEGCIAFDNYSDLYNPSGNTMHVIKTQYDTLVGSGTWDKDERL